MTKILTMGEMLLRLKPTDHQRIIQANTYDANYGGSEANVAVSLALLGDDVELLTKLPQNALGDMALNTVRQYGVKTQKILRGGRRLGIYFFEKGASVRNTNVVYDRADSSFATVSRTEFDWEKLLGNVDYFYFSGITAALSDSIRASLLDACKACRDRNVTVVCDMNYRGKMWTPKEAQACMQTLMPYINICIANDEDFEATLGIKAFDGDMTRGIEQKQQFEQAMREVQAKYPNCHTVASVLRDIHSVEDSQWTAMMLHDGQMVEGPTYKMHVYEGVAGGDAFGAGLVHGFVNGFKAQELIDYAITASVMKLTIPGDLNLATDQDIRNAMASGNSVNR
ncbi:sugar kinase [Lacticaseibacillus chiayiensis]|uniref:sugar kinase n=1 Tax=Lacticaseibacillus chiayiensis TaxID=2100821 RepID=UPI001011A56A|nr:sugar kinase [Lacticaseibacillus chiayiensis]RXT58273.1 2-dehydro-3-deoxygluconokinase [Lacticaseibacillus chiayiensis]